MNKVALFCKSYRDDVLRAKRLARSVERFNTEGLPLYVSVPSSDLALFQEHCAGLPLTLISDEQIVASNPGLDSKAFAQLPGGLAQQIVKSEFWRLGNARNYVCLDSDCYFLRPFGESDFLAPDDAPYTVMHEAKELLHFALIAGLSKIGRNRSAEGEEIMGLFGRSGRFWDFGPVPVVWSAKVWRDLDEKFLKPRGLTFLDAIRQHPGELRWYGEALLAYRSIPLWPVEPLFRCYHYEEQFYFWKKSGETEEKIAENYLGICMQSNWDKQLDLVKRFRFSKLRRRIKRAIKGI
ncbi:MAG TPA: DUF6492 family protein [Burkholderiales bacterium]|nr:DUF6492 family protein [Burkholderiales bacterium]